jgi:hypothetical protein
VTCATCVTLQACIYAGCYSAARAADT